MRGAPSGWQVHRLDELGFVGRGKSRHRPRNDPRLYGGPYPFVQTSDIRVANLRLKKFEQTYNEAGLAQSKMWKPGTLCITIAANIAETAILSLQACFPDSVIGFVADPQKSNEVFIKYYIDIMKLKMQQVSHGTTQDNLSMDKLLRFEFLVPPVLEQQKIASILSAYDNLIENNLRRIKILEDMAQTLYREWFVRFRFPGYEKVKMVNSPFGKIPDGWEVKQATDAILVNPLTKVPKEGYKPFVAMDGLSNNSMIITNTKPRTGNNGSKFKNGDTLFARITPCLENGKTGFVQFLPSDNAVAFGSTEFIVLRSKTLCPELVYLIARSAAFRDIAIKSMSGATGRQRVQEECFDKFTFAHPDVGTIDMFAKQVTSMFRFIKILSGKNTTLRVTRELLLPKLISGEIDVEKMDIDVGGLGG